MAELRVKGTGTIKLFESDNTSSVTIASPASLSADKTITLPDADVTLVSGTMLATDGDGSGLSGVGKCLQVMEIGFASATATTISAGAGSALLTLDMTVSASSKVLCWFISGETDRGDADINPKTTIRVDTSVITASAGTNHWFIGTGGEDPFRTAITQSALSSALSAGTRTIDVYCDAYGGDVVYNFQNANEGRLQVMEIGA